MRKKFYIFDMDGVLVEYRRDMSPEKASMMAQKGYFLNLRPEWNMILAMQMLFNICPSQVYILTSVFCKQFPYSVSEKIEYMEKVFPYMKNNMIIVDSENGETKAEKFEKVTGHKIGKNCYLIDDYGVNLKAWKESGGTPVKYLNLINNTHGTYYEHKLNCFMPPETIFSELSKI